MWPPDQHFSDYATTTPLPNHIFSNFAFISSSIMWPFGCYHKWVSLPRSWKRKVIVMFEEMDLLLLLFNVQTSTKQYIVLETWRLVLVKSNSNLNVTKAASIHIMTKFPGSAFNWRQLGVGRLLNAVMSLDKSHNWGYCDSVSITSSKCYCY